MYDNNLNNKYVVTLDNFDGPLDLLLHLIKEQDIDIFKITQITASNYNGFKNDVGILVNKNDTSAREETRCIRTTIINDNQISVSYIAKDLSQSAPKGYTFTYFGAIGVEKHS